MTQERPELSKACETGMEMPSMRITRKRHLELTKVSADLCDWLERQGVTRLEGCRVRMITEQLWDLIKE